VHHFDSSITHTRTQTFYMDLSITAKVLFFFFFLSANRKQDMVITSFFMISNITSFASSVFSFFSTLLRFLRCRFVMLYT
jgi:hypothetical protein